MNLEAILQSHGVELAKEGDPHTTPGWISMECPYCGKGSGKHHLGLNRRFLNFNCWKCGKHDFVETMQRLTGLNFGELIDLKKKLPRGRGKVLTQNKRTGGIYSYDFAPGPLLPQHRKYLRSRRFDPDEVSSLWSIQGIGLCSGWAWRLFLPIYDQGRPVSWTTRSIDPTEELRYRSAAPTQEVVAHKSLLYGEWLVKGPAIIVHEGPLDAITTGPGAVATFGSNYSHEQVNRIGFYPIRVICFDSETQAQKQALRLAQQLSLLPGETYRVKLSGKDANSSPAEEIQELRHRFLEC